MVRVLGSSVIAAALVALIIGGVAAATGQLTIFEPAAGTLTARVSAMEGFLEDHSRAVKTEMALMQGEIDHLYATPTPAPAWASATNPETCPTDAEAAYLVDLLTHVGTLVAELGNLPFDDMGTILEDDNAATYDLETEALRTAAQHIRDLTPPNTRRALMVHDLTLHMVDEALDIVDALEHATEVRNPILLLRAMGDMFGPLLEATIVIYVANEICDLSSIWPPEAPPVAPTASYE